ncbi:hypothetical protein GCM10023169_09260 [Georgenia halophila]|uniref:DUF8175 domain-containing protein n=1 Tax=Georgenia halophila TaxID=620889 RepID=A0ABP8KZ85_9MICO
MSTTTPPAPRRRLLLGAVAALGLMLGACTSDDEPTSGGDDQPTSESPSGESPSSESPSGAAPTSEAADASVCGLSVKPDVDPAALDVDWVEDSHLGYPASEQAGPAATAEAGYRYCYQHSTGGALLFLANGLAQAVNPDLVEAFAEYAVADGPRREEMLDRVRTVDVGPYDPVIAGYAVREADEDSASIAIVVEAGEEDGPPHLVAVTADLVWRDGDWKLSSEKAQSVRYELVHSLDDYVAWGP